MFYSRTRLTHALHSLSIRVRPFSRHPNHITVPHSSSEFCTLSTGQSYLLPLLPMGQIRRYTDACSATPHAHHEEVLEEHRHDLCEAHREMDAEGMPRVVETLRGEEPASETAGASALSVEAATAAAEAAAADVDPSLVAAVGGMMAAREMADMVAGVVLTSAAAPSTTAATAARTPPVDSAERGTRPLPGPTSSASSTRERRSERTGVYCSSNITSPGGVGRNRLGAAAAAVAVTSPSGLVREDTAATLPNMAQRDGRPHHRKQEGGATTPSSPSSRAASISPSSARSAASSASASIGHRHDTTTSASPEAAHETVDITRRINDDPACAVWLDGAGLAAQLQRAMTQEVRYLKMLHTTDESVAPAPGLAVIVVGQRADSLSYVRRKRAAAVACGFRSFEISLPEDVSQIDLEDEIRALNNNPAVHGVVLQLPLPEGLNEARALEQISPAKDVDGLHTHNVGMLHSRGRAPFFLPCTPLGISRILEYYQVPIAGRHAVVIGRSNIVGLPVGQMLLQQNATVSICHSGTKDLKRFVQQAEILVCACGCPGMIKGDWVQPGAVVIDVGISPIPDETSSNGFRLCGDVAFDEVAQVAGFLTPVPRGVGPMTVAMLLENTLRGFKRTAGLLTVMRTPPPSWGQKAQPSS
jgi:5,10-methylene-tetrahydrofolate dehydrogenase/methenyl tetrahydrofolate cyclohydrolase